MLVLSCVIGPPDESCFFLSLRVRSPLMVSQFCPALVVFIITFEAMYNSLGSCGENAIGKLHWKRYFSTSAPYPIGLSGHALMLRICPVLWSWRVIRLPYDPA